MILCVCVFYILGGKEEGTCLLYRPGPIGEKLKQKGKEHLVLAPWSICSFLDGRGCLLSTH